MLSSTLETPEADARSWDALGISYESDGALILSGSASALFQGWCAHLLDSLWPYYHTVYQSSTFISCSVLEKAGYVEHFPQNLLAATSVLGQCAACLSPAACLHLYPMLARQPLEDEGSAVMVSGPCARYEGGDWVPPFRLSSFHMMELVAVGTREYVEVTRDAVTAEIEKMFEAAGIEGGFEHAEDAFFLGTSSGARMVQKLKGLKQEFLAPYEDSSVALASVNDHEDYFGRRFGIEDVNGRPANSFCVAFGIERLTAMGLRTWGASPADWPEGLRL